jgi:hypothetical protein
VGILGNVSRLMAISLQLRLNLIVYFAQLAGVDDVVTVLDCVGYLVAEQPVGIGKNGYCDYGSTGL